MQCVAIKGPIRRPHNVDIRPIYRTNCYACSIARTWITTGVLMAGRKIQVPFPTPESTLVDAYEVDIMESTERWTEVHLEDGSILRFKPSILSALRINCLLYTSDAAD